MAVAEIGHQPRKRHCLLLLYFLNWFGVAKAATAKPCLASSFPNATATGKVYAFHIKVPLKKRKTRRETSCDIVLNVSNSLVVQHGITRTRDSNHVLHLQVFFSLHRSPSLSSYKCLKSIQNVAIDFLKFTIFHQFPNETDLPGNTGRPWASGFQKFAIIDHNNLNFCPIKV